MSNTFQNCKVNLVVFTGVAGAVNKKLRQWDIVLSEAVIQHDMDARPLFDKFVIPAIGEKQIKVKESLINYFYDVLEKNIRNKKHSKFKPYIRVLLLLEICLFLKKKS